MICVLWWNCGNGFWDSDYAYSGTSAVEHLIDCARNLRGSYLVIYENGVLRRSTGLYDHWYVTAEEPIGEPIFLDGEWHYEASYRTIDRLDEIVEFLTSIRR